MLSPSDLRVFWRAIRTLPISHRLRLCRPAGASIADLGDVEHSGTRWAARPRGIDTIRNPDASPPAGCQFWTEELSHCLFMRAPVCHLARVLWGFPGCHR